MGGRAVVALVVGIVAFAVCVVSPALGIVAGAVAIWLAGSRRKAGDKAGFALTARICGIVAIVFSIIAVFMALAAGSASLSALLGDAVDEARLGSQASFSMEDGAVSSDDEWKAVEAVAPRFERLKTGDEQMAAQVGSVVDAGFTQLTGFSLRDCGIDPAEYGAAAMEGFSYEIVLVSAYSGSDDGFVSADVTAKDAFDIFNAFSDSLGDYADSSECASASEDERRAKVGELLMEAVRQAPLYPDSYCSVDVRHEGDAWVVDEDSWNSEMDYLFGIA